ncbi:MULTISPECIES: hypothetical protein [Streptomyces]|uniref:hypothetical protein n=1 Tax=Streptomyces TaxID=1883 RepID=UPI0011803F2E|nr:hypothetical protein [Streptomyces kasugaensis]
MTSIDTVFASLAARKAWDIRLPGFIDREDTVPRFTPLADTAYVALDKGYLRLESTGNFGQLAMRIVAAPGFPKVLEEEEEEFSLASYGHLFFADAHSDFRITRIRYALNGESTPGRGTVRCAEFEFEHTWPLFVDPGYHFGIRLEGAGAFDRWLADNQDPASPLGPARSLTWSP